MNEKRLRWLVWIWRVVGASYVAGVLSLSPYGATIVVWAALLFTPLLIVTLVATRSKLIAWVGIPIVLAALIVGAAMLMQVQTRFTIFGYPGLAMMLFLAAAAGGVWMAWTILAGDVKRPERS